MPEKVVEARKAKAKNAFKHPQTPRVSWNNYFVASVGVTNRIVRFQFFAFQLYGGVRLTQ